jgi:hypothetical protein
MCGILISTGVAHTTKHFESAPEFFVEFPEQTYNQLALAVRTISRTTEGFEILAESASKLPENIELSGSSPDERFFTYELRTANLQL